MNDNELTTQEKIDYIYESIKKQEKNEKLKNIIKWSFRGFIILYIIYFYLFGFKIFINSIKDSLKIEIGNGNIINTVKNKINLDNNHY